MRALMIFLLAANLLPQKGCSFRREFKMGVCDTSKWWRRHNKSVTGVCTAVLPSVGESATLLTCALPLRRTRELECAGGDAQLKSDPPEKKNITLYLDYKFTLLFEDPEEMTRGHRGRVKCSSEMAMSYKETPRGECAQYPPPPSRMFKGLQGREGLPTEFELVDSVPIGSAIVDDSCLQCEERETSACRIRAKIHWKGNREVNSKFPFTGKLIEASIDNELLDNHSQATVISPLQFETRELSNICYISNNIITYNTINGWQAVSSVMSHFRNISALNISGSPIQYFGAAILMGMHQLRELTASSCNIRVVDDDAFKDNLLLVYINLSKNELNTLQSCLFKNLKHLIHLDISHNKFTHGQSFDFYKHSEWPNCGMQLLDMSSNALERAANLIGFGSKVKHVNLADNLLKNLSAMITGRWINEVNLSGNRITTLSLSSLKSLTALKYVNLNDNLFDCGSCDLLNFQIWLNKTGRKILSSAPENLRCSFPAHLRQQKKKVLEVEYEVRSCLDQYNPKSETEFFQLETINQTILLLLVTIIITLFTTTVTIYHQELFQYMKNILRTAISKKKREFIYDASISYSTRDESWVLHELRPALEDGEQKYKLFLNDRQLELGRIMEQYVEKSMRKCRRSIIILCDDFLSRKCKDWERAECWGLKTHQDNVILIAREEINRDDIPQHLKSMINEGTFLKWPCKPSCSFHENEINPGKTNVSYKCLQELFWKDLFKALGASIFIEASINEDIDYRHDPDESKDENS